MSEAAEVEVFDLDQEQVSKEVEVNNEIDLEENLEADSSEEEKPKQSRSQNAKQRLRRKLREEERRNVEMTERLEAEQARIDALESKLDSVINPPPDRPMRVEFETEEEYEDALYDYRTPKSVESQVVTPEKQVSNEKSQLSDDVRENWEDQLDYANEKYSDFEDVMVSIPPENMTDIMANAIFESRQGGEVAYFLGKNKSEAVRISKLSLSGQIRELDLISAKFEKNTTNAPSPISPIGGKGDVMTEKTDPLLDGATFE